MEHIEGLQEFEDQFKTLMLEKEIKNISLYNVNPQYFAFDADRIWVLDGGIEITFSNNTSVSYCWNKEMELMELVQGSPGQIMDDLDYYTVEGITQKVNNLFNGKVVSKINFEWNWYQKLDENFELEDKLNFAPLGIILHTSDEQSLQLAAIRFAVNKEDMTLGQASYLPEGDMLVSMNEIVEISLPEEAD